MIEFRATVKNGVIKIPDKYRDQIKNQVRVVLFSEGEEPNKGNLIDHLLEHPIQIDGFKPLKRGDLYER